jgi:hypothetical protein
LQRAATETLNLYRVCDRTLASNILLPELPPARGQQDWSFVLMPARADAHRPPASWFHEWRLPDGQVWLYFSRAGDTYVLSFPELAEFQISGAGTEILCYPVPDIPIESLKHLLLDQVLPLLLSQRGKLVLHASAVAGPGGALAFTGPSGEGKSTLAASFSTHGYDLLTDDCLMLEDRSGSIFGTPLYPSLRLYPEVIQTLFPEQPVCSPVTHYSSKLRLALEPSGVRIQIQPVRLDRIYILDPEHAPAVRITPLGFREAFLEILKLTYLMDVHDPGTLKSEFESVARAAALPLFRRLSYPREFSALPAVRREILSELS